MTIPAGDPARMEVKGRFRDLTTVPSATISKERDGMARMAPAPPELKSLIKSLLGLSKCHYISKNSTKIFFPRNQVIIFVYFALPNLYAYSYIRLFLRIVHKSKLYKDPKAMNSMVSE